MFTKADIEKYFTAEKQESLLFIIIGVLAIAAALAFYLLMKSAFFKGAAIPLFFIGMIQLAVGYTVYTRSDDDRIRNVYAYDMNPGELKTKEIPRMEKVNKNFIIYRWVEIILFAVGVILILTNSRNPEGRAFWYGLGIALALQAFITLTADYFAEKRGLAYHKGLLEFTKEIR